MNQEAFDVETWDGTAPLPALFTKTADGAINTWVCWIEGCYVHMTWGQVGGAMQSGSYVCTPKNTGRTNATTAEEQARLEAISRWKKQLKKKYFMGESEAKTGFNLKPMLAKVFRKAKKVSYPASLQPKLDGLRCLAYRKDGKVFLQSRGGDPYSVAHIMEALEQFLPEGLILDGELYVHGMLLQDINSLVRRPQPDSLLLEYHVYDCVSPSASNMPWPERRDLLAAWFCGVPNTFGIVAVPTWTVNNEQEVMDYHNRLVANGFEGAIVRLLEGTYRFGYRSSDLLKVKEFQDEEFLVVGWKKKKENFVYYIDEDGNTRTRAVLVPCLICRTKDDVEFDVSMADTHKERARLFEQLQADESSYVGKQLTVRFFGYTKKGTPFLPVGVAIREPGS